MKTRRNRIWKTPRIFLERWTMCFMSCKNCELIVKLWWVGTRERKNSAFFVTCILSEWNFCNSWFFSLCIVYWIYFQNIYTFPYQKLLIYTFWLVVFKVVESVVHPWKNMLKWDWFWHHNFNPDKAGLFESSFF